MEIKKIERTQTRETIDLIWTTFFAITVNSSPYAVPVYHKLGFVDTDVEQISEIYPHYYPKGAVDFFLEHHSKGNILDDIKKGIVYLCFDASQNAVGTVTIKNNEICRLFVLPSYQNKGVGTEMLDFAEKTIFQHYSKVILDASLPARKLYLKRGYIDIEFNIIATGDNDFLCYDVMEKQAQIGCLKDC